LTNDGKCKVVDEFVPPRVLDGNFRHRDFRDILGCFTPTGISDQRQNQICVSVTQWKANQANAFNGQSWIWSDRMCRMVVKASFEFEVSAQRLAKLPL
jgi:hypothetical protein